MNTVGNDASPIMGRGRWTRILPIAFVMYTISFFDRVNLGQALPHITADLHLTPVQAGYVGGAFAWGYVVTQLLAGWIVLRMGSRRVIGISLFLFGAAAIAVGLTRNMEELIAARVMLGLAEGPIYAATCHLLSQWFIKRERGRAFGIWNLSLGFGAFLAGPISGLLLTHYSWRVMMVVEGLPAWLFMLIWFWGIPKSINHASWLSSADREEISSTLQEEQQAYKMPEHDPWWTILGEPAMWLMLAAFSLNGIMLYGFTLWLPTALKSVGGLGPFMIGIYSGLPFIMAMLGTLYITRRSDKHNQERRLHAAVPTALTGVSMIVVSCIPAQYYVAQIVMFCAVGFTMKMLVPLIFSRLTEILPEAKAIPAVALVSGLGNLIGQFAGPVLVGYVKNLGTGFTASWAALGVCSLLAAVAAYFARSRSDYADQREKELDGSVRRAG